MRYLKKINGAWHYRPPKAAVNAGIVSPWSEENYGYAMVQWKRDDKLLKSWQKGELAGADITGNSNLSQVAAHYMETSHFLSLQPNSQKSYRYLFTKIGDTFGNLSVSKIRTKDCQSAYDKWVIESAANAKMLVRGFSILINHAIGRECADTNYMNYVKKVSTRPVSVLWSREQVDKFVSTAFSKWEWRNIGILVLLCYEYAQRPIDIAHLTWDNVDFEKNQITIHQSKRGATVYVPMDEQVRQLLLNQYQDFKFQKWVLPQLRAIDGAYRPYTNNQFASLGSDIIAAAGLPSELKIGKLRNTAITEMVEAGVDSTGIMQVSGHANIQSINPYLSNTLRGASTALDKRKEK